MTFATSASRIAAALLAAAGLAAQAQAPSSAAAPLPAPPRVALVDRIVAVVNDQVITQNDLRERLESVKRQFQRQGGQMPSDEVIARQLLERMINDLVQVQMARETGIRVDDPTLDKTIERIAQENKMSTRDFRAAIERDGINYARFREDIRNEILLARLREREVENALIVTDAEVETELARQARQPAADFEYRLAHILVAVPPQASPEQIESRRRRAVQALSEVRRGADFARVAATYSDAPDALQGGNLGWRHASRLPALFLEAVQILKPGDVSDIMRSANGFHVVKLLEQRGRAQAAPGVQQTRVRHILLRAREGLSEAEARDRLQKIRERIAAGEDFAELARQHSEDGSGPRGGDLGWVAAGDTVPEFERVMNSLKEKEVSPPVQTPFGWHLVQVLERRAEELSEERKKAAARQAIRARKADEAYQDWLRQMRDRAFVENRYEER